MFCKHCGSKLDPKNPICPVCGTSATLNGGNGFWDMVGEPRRNITPQLSTPVVKEKVVVKEVKKPAIVPIAISVVLCLICLIGMIVGRISTRKAARELSANYEAQISQQKYSYEEQIGQLESKINELEEELNCPVEPTVPVRVLRSPTPETKPEGYSNPTGSWLFGFTIEGPASEFRWEKQLNDGTWIALKFDYRDIDSRYGLKIEQDLEEGTSKLVAVGITPDSEGNYKCTVITSHGSESVEVSLTIEKNSPTTPAPTSSPAPAVTPIPTSSPDDSLDDNTSIGNSGQVEDPSQDSRPDSTWIPWGGYHG